MCLHWFMQQTQIVKKKIKNQIKKKSDNRHLVLINVLLTLICPDARGPREETALA